MSYTGLDASDLPGTAHEIHTARLRAGLPPHEGYDPATGALEPQSHAWSVALARHRSRELDALRSKVRPDDGRGFLEIGHTTPETGPAWRVASADDLRAVFQGLTRTQARAVSIAALGITGTARALAWLGARPDTCTDKKTLARASSACGSALARARKVIARRQRTGDLRGLGLPPMIGEGGQNDV